MTIIGLDQVTRLGGKRVIVDGEELDPAPSLRLRNHSPTGFSWGYGGSGPAQLALAILLVAGLSETDALDFYQQFKWEHIARLPQTPFVVEIDVLGWVREAKGH